MIKVKDGYAKLIGTTYLGSADRVLLSNGGDHVLGNASGNIPLSNGTVNTNLNADLLDGLHGSYYAAASSLSNYLPLAGGTMQSTASIYWRDRGAFGDTEATYPYTYGGLKWSGTSDFVHLYAEESSRDLLKLVLNFGDDTNPTLSIRLSGTEVAYIGANGKFYGSHYQSYVATGTQPYACSSTTLNTNLNADMLDGVHLAGYGGKAGVMRSWARGTYTTVNQYFGNGNVVVIDPKPTDDSTLSPNTIIFSLGENSIRNTLLAFMYERDEIKYRRAYGESTVNWSPWKTIAFTDSDISGNAATASLLKSNSTTSVSAGLLFYAGWMPQGNTNNRSWCSPTGTYTNNSVKGEYGSIVRVNYGNTYYNELFFDANSTRPSWRKVTGTNSTGWKTLGLLEDIRPSGYVTSSTASLSSYWGKLWEYTLTALLHDLDITFYIHSAYNLKRGFVHIRVRRNPVTTDGVTTYTNSVNMLLISGNIPTSDIRLYHDATTGKMELWVNVILRWGVYNANVISCTERIGNELMPILGTLFSTDFTTELTLPTYSYISLRNLNSHQVYVLLHTNNSIEYPLIWSNRTNADSITADLLYKSYPNLTYNPYINRITASLFKAGKSLYSDGWAELYGDTPFIDFHHKSSTEDYTNRIIEGLAGQLTVTGKLRIGVLYTTSTDYNFHVNGTGAFNLSLHLMEGAELHLKAAANSTDPGDIVFKDGNNTEIGRIYKSPAENNFYVRFSNSDSGKTMLHSGNSSVSDYVVKINNTTKNFVRDWGSGATDMNAVARGGRSSMGMASLKTPSGGTATAVNPDGLTDWHHFINIAFTDGGNGSNSWITQIANKAGSTDLWVRSRKGGTIDDTATWTAGWTRILTGSNYTSVLDGNYVKAYKTLNSTYNIDDDWGLSVVTFDPKALGTYPSSGQLANFTLLNLGNSFERRKLFGFDWYTDSIFYRRHINSAWTSWVTLLHSGNYSDLLDSRYYTESEIDTKLNTVYQIKGFMGSYSASWNWDDYKTIGSYKVQTGTTITNHPTYSGTSGSYPYGIAYIIQGHASDGENRTVQMYFPHNWIGYGNIPLYTRMLNGSSWTSWARIPSTDYVNDTITSALGSYYTKTESDSSYVNVTGDTMTGVLSMKNDVNPRILFIPNSGSSTLGAIYLMGGSSTAYSGIKYKFRQWSYTANSLTRLSYYEDYNLPETAAGLPANASYTILTTKNASVTKSGQTLTVTINGTSQSLTNSTYNFSGISFTSGQSDTGSHDCNAITSNGHWYYSSNGPSTSIGATTNDGALYSLAYSSSWVGQIAQDYRDGDLFTRGKKDGTWTAWKLVAYALDFVKKSGDTLSSGSAQIQRAGSLVSWYLGRSNAMIRINSYSGYNAIASMKTTNGDWSLGVYDNNILYFTYITDTNFNAGSNTTTAQVSINASGNLYATHFYENSDEQLKTNIQEILNSDKMPIIKEFDWKEDNSHSYGLIAQELEEQGYSELVSIKDDGYRTVNYSAALSLIVGKLQVKIKELEKEIENLKNKN